MRRREEWPSILIGVVTAAALSSPAVAGEREQEIMKHGEQMIALLACGHYATEAFGYDKAQPFLARGIEEGRAFYEGVFSKEYDPEEIHTLMSLHLTLSVAGVSPDFSLGYMHGKLETASYGQMTEGYDPESTEYEGLKKMAGELFSSANCEALRT